MSETAAAIDDSGDSSQRDSELEELRNRLDALSNRFEAHTDELWNERERRQDLEDELEELKDDHAELQAELAELRDRTDLLKLVKNADDADGRQRSVAIIQHMRRAARKREEIGEQPRLAIDRDRAEEILHYPDVHRTTIYSDMERAERLVGDNSILRCVDGDLLLDMDAGDPADHVTGLNKSGGGE